MVMDLGKNVKVLQCKGSAMIRFSNSEIRNAEIHWYEAHGIGKKEIKIKHLLR
jgi:hypothetical protein